MSSTINHFISDDKDEREDGGINADNHTDGKTVDSGWGWASNHRQQRSIKTTKYTVIKI